MFTGLVRERGRVRSLAGDENGVGLRISAPETSAGAEVGDSIAVNGCCLTATAVEDGEVTFHAVPETLARTALAGLSEGADVNLEPSLRVGEPLGGHFVQGHVDGVGTVRSVDPEGEGLRIWITAPSDLLRYVVEKGSIAVDGVSLTVAAESDGAFAVALVPHTLAATTVGALAPGDAVNLEVDLLAKYVERLAAGPGGEASGVIITER